MPYERTGAMDMFWSQPSDLTLALDGSQLAVRDGLDQVLADPVLAELSEDARGSLWTVLAEVLNNIVEHAYAGESGQIYIEVETEPSHYLKIVLSDTGRTFAPDQIPLYVPCTPATDVASLKVGGLGLHLMRQTMDDVCFEFNVPGHRGVFNRLTMIKRL